MRQILPPPYDRFPTLVDDPLVRYDELFAEPGSAGHADITVVIATIPPRAALLARALASVAAQTLQPKAIVVEYDHGRTGAAATKNRAIWKADTEWVAPLDDDDLFLPDHLEQLRLAQCRTCNDDSETVEVESSRPGGAPTVYAYAPGPGADVVYSVPHIPQIPGFRDPDGRYGQPFDAEEMLRRSYVQTTSLLRTSAVLTAGGFQVPDVVYDPQDPRRNYDDWGLYKQILARGGQFHHLNMSTFIWNHWGYGMPTAPGNTSGDPARW